MSPALAETSRRAPPGAESQEPSAHNDVGPGAVERFRELEQDLHPLALAWLRDESVEEHMSMRGTVFPPSVVVQHQGWSRELKTAPGCCGW